MRGLGILVRNYAAASSGGGGGGGTTVLSILDTIYAALANGGEVDQLVSSGDFHALVFATKHNAATWKAATSVYTVPTGKQAALMTWMPASGVVADNANRKVRLFNISAAAEQVGDPSFVNNRGMFPFSGDGVTAAKVPTHAAGVQFRMEAWNFDTNARAMAGYAIFREFPA